MAANHKDTPVSSWRPAADLDMLRRRAELLSSIRAFFRDREVLEIETPLLGRYGASDPNIHGFHLPGRTYPVDLYLQTSPEYAMKRLLAAGSGPIYQICKAFRVDEQGRRHNPEFSMLEWYRPGLNSEQLAGEVVDLLINLLGELPVSQLSYAQAFERYLDLDTEQVGHVELIQKAVGFGLAAETASCSEPDTLLDFLFSSAIEPRLADAGITVIRDYPASQAALARLQADNPRLADRFEVFVHGLELANGYRELADPQELRARFAKDKATRRQHGMEEVAADPRLLAALEAGLPDCSGVAMGLDRVLMLATGVQDIRQVLSFPFDRA